MDAICEPNAKFDYNKLLLTPPVSVSNGNHFIKFSMSSNPLYIQTPRCKIKQGIIKTSKKLCCDLMFTIENEEFIQWIENLENYCQNYIYTKRDKWFETNLEKDDIENSFISSLKLFKSGKFYNLRVNIPTVLGKVNIKVYDENENLLNIEQIEEDKNVVSILEVQGVKCSIKGFQIEMEMKQLLVLNKENIFEKCILIKKTITADDNKSNNQIKEIIHSPSEPIQEGVLQELDTETPEFVQETKETLTEGHQEDPENSSKEPIHLEINIDEPIDSGNIEILKEKEDNPELFEVDFDLEKMSNENTITLKNRNDVFYKMYKDAMKKAKMAKDLALSSYLEAKRIKNTHMLEELSDESDFDEESLNFIDEE